MKKLFCLLLSLLILCGCSSDSHIDTFMVMKATDQYSLYDINGELQSNLTFKTYKENYQRGYLVTDVNDKQGYIDYYGEIIVDYGQYDSLQFADEMVIGTKVIEEKNGEETITVNTYYIIDNEGKVLYSSDDQTNIKISGLPIVKKDNICQVLYENGKVLYADEYDVNYVLHDDVYSLFVIVTDTFVDVYYYGNDDILSVNVPISGKFVLSDVMNSGALLYDKDQKTVIYVNLAENTSHMFNNITADKIYFDESKQIVVEVGSTVSLLTIDTDKPKVMNSYYKDIETYVNRSSEVYGPHTLYENSKQTANLTGCQLFPAASKIEGNYFPVYVRDGGYQFYGFDGKQPFTTSFYDAEAFDKNNRAIVRDGTAVCYLINESGLPISKNYNNIKYIGNSYYAAFNKDGNFGIIDKDGNVILPMGYTTLPDNCVFHYDGEEYIMVEKYGRTYVYNASDEYKEVFSVEGDTIFNEKGYYIVNGESYYNYEGELIH